MSDFVLDFAVNTFEAFSVYVLILASFRFPIRSYLTRALLASAIAAQTSYLMRFVLHLDSYTPLFMLLWLIVLITFFFKVHPFYSLLMSVTGYLSYIMIQTLLLLTLQLWFSLDQIVSPLLHVKLFQTLCSIITLGFAMWLNLKRIGYSFVPDSPRVKVKLTGLNLVLLLISIASSLLISGVALLILGGGLLTSLIGSIFLLAILIVLNLAYKREMTHD